MLFRSVSAQDFCQKGEEDGLELFHAHAQGLGDKDIVEPVHSQARELVKNGTGIMRLNGHGLNLEK